MADDPKQEPEKKAGWFPKWKEASVIATVIRFLGTVNWKDASIIAATITFMVAVYNASQNLAIETMKVEGTFILEALKTQGNKQQVRNSFRMLLETGLVTGDLKRRLGEYLKVPDDELPVIIGCMQGVEEPDRGSVSGRVQQ